MRAGAASHGWDLSGVEIFELVPPENLLDEDQQQSLLYSSDLELGETTKRVFETFERARPHRVVLDSLSEIRLLAQSSQDPAGLGPRSGRADRSARTGLVSGSAPFRPPPAMVRRHVWRRASEGLRMQPSTGSISRQQFHSCREKFLANSNGHSHGHR